MRRNLLIIALIGSLLLPAFGAEDDRKLVTYHWWLSYKELPYAAYPMGLPDSKFHIKGHSPVFGYSPLAVLHTETDLDPFCAIRFRIEGFEEINPFKSIVWRPNEILSENNYKEDKKIKMITAFVNPESSVSTVVLSNSGKEPWKQELVFYSKGTSVLQEEYIARKAVTVTNQYKTGASAMGIFFDKSTVEDIFVFQENGRYRIITKLNVPAGSEVSFSIGVGLGNDARTAAILSFTAAGKNVIEMESEKEVFYNKLLSNIVRIYATDISTRKMYQATYLLLNGYRREDITDFALRFVYEEKLEKILGKKLWPWVYWKAYEFTGDTRYLETAVENGENYQKMENEALELYNQRTLEWAGSIIGKKAVFTPVKVPEDLKNEQLVLNHILQGEDKNVIEKEVKQLLNFPELKYPEIYFILDNLVKYDIKGSVPALYEKQMPFTQYDDDRPVSEVFSYMDMYFKNCGIDFTRGNLYIQPLDMYKFRFIYNFKYKGNLIDIAYARDGKFIDKILVNGQSVCSRIIYIPEGSQQYKIEVQLSNWPGNPILNSIKTNTWYKVLRCSYDDKTAIFNIEMDSPPLESLKAIINITKNSKWIKRVTINWKDISKFEDIKVEYKDRGF
ncbi:MAG: hypothetical protein A2231_00720 [Candidatus Firestonebacteria bacterium RIFOXYA2_FULL_40_8]|nr:MAG: hypothetical protein A2231_00720 [Candidatus Firestonebacteria bacterium RIFOXYA2_FULL_40_8]